MSAQLTNISFSCFLILLNLKKPSLSLRECLFFMEPEPEAGAGWGMGFKGEEEGNLVEEWETWPGPSTLLLTRFWCLYTQVSKIKYIYQKPVYLYNVLLSSRSSVPQRPFTSSITWFFRNFFRSCTVCCLVTSGPKLLLLRSSWCSQSTAAEAVKQEAWCLKFCLCFLTGIPARKCWVTSFH